MQPEAVKKLDQVFLEIEKRIVQGEWHLGDRIPTEAQLAAEFHCSIGTVSKAIARLTHVGMLERRTRAGTRIIRNSAERTGAAAPALQLNAYAFICPGAQHEGIARIMQGFQGAAHEDGRQVLALTTGSNFRQEAEIIGRLGEFAVKGAAVYPVIVSPQDQIYYMQMLMACPFPVVLAGVNLPGIARPAVVSDGQHAGYTVTRHLLAKGLRKVGFLANYAWVPSTRDRYLGYRLAMEEAGLGEHPEWVHLEQGMSPNFENPLDEPTRIATAYLDARRDAGLEGLVCASDFLAHGALAAARERGLSVPDGLRVAGIDDFRLLPETDPALTTYRIPFEEVGRRAFAALRARIEGRGEGPMETLVRGELVVRRSA